MSPLLLLLCICVSGLKFSSYIVRNTIPSKVINLQLHYLSGIWLSHYSFVTYVYTSQYTSIQGVPPLFTDAYISFNIEYLNFILFVMKRIFLKIQFLFWTSKHDKKITFFQSNFIKNCIKCFVKQIILNILIYLNWSFDKWLHKWSFFFYFIWGLYAK